jgi:lactate permease
MALYGGWRSVRALWPMLLVAGLSFGIAQFAASNYLDYTLTDVFAALGSLAVTLLFLQVWKPAADPEFAFHHTAGAASAATAAADARPVPAWQGWLPWVIVTATVILWTFLKLATVAQHSIAWPGLDKAVSITLYNGKPYAAMYAFQPLGTGTAILLAALITAPLVGLSLSQLGQCALRTIRQIWQAVLTVMLIVALAYVMNYSGLAYSLGLAVASTGRAFVLFSPFLGWVAVFLSGSDTSGNALFGNLQVVAARQLKLNPLLFAATNSSGGVLGKMISPQNIATGVSVTNLKGQEGTVLARTFLHSIVLTLVLVLIVIVQQYVLPGIIPSFIAK